MKYQSKCDFMLVFLSVSAYGTMVVFHYFVCEFLLVSGCMSLFLSLSKCF